MKASEVEMSQLMYQIVIMCLCIATAKGIALGNRVTSVGVRREVSMRISSKFDLHIARSIAGFAFDVYNEPPLGKVATGRDKVVKYTVQGGLLTAEST